MKHGDSVTSATFSEDGERIVTASRDKFVRVWNATTAEELRPPMRHDEIVKSAKFSPNGTLVLTVSATSAQVWDLATGSLRLPLLMHDKEVFDASFSRDGSEIVTASRDGTARLWRTDTLEKVGGPLEHADAVIAARFSPDGKRVLTASWDRTARVWDADTGTPISPPLPHEGSMVAQFAPADTHIITASLGGTARIWDPDKGRVISEQRLKADVDLATVELSPTNKLVATIPRDGTVRIWDVGSAKAMVGTSEHREEVVGIRFSIDGKSILSVGLSGIVRAWNAETGEISGPPIYVPEGVKYAFLSKEGPSIVVITSNKAAQLWDLGQRFLGSNHIRRPRRVCRTMCG